MKRSGSANEQGLMTLGNLVGEHDRSSSPGPSRRRKRPRWSRRRKAGTACLAAVVAVVGIVTIAYVDVHYEWNRVHKVACHVCTPEADGKPFNVLIVGSDSRSGNSGQATRSFGSASKVGGQRSDTIKIIHIDPAIGTARVLSIPRDTYVTMSGLAASTDLTGAQQINTAFNNGPNALIETIQNTFGIPINHWVVIDFNGVVDSVTALRGIDLRFKYPVRDSNDGVNESGLNLEAPTNDLI